MLSKKGKQVVERGGLDRNYGCCVVLSQPLFLGMKIQKFLLDGVKAKKICLYYFLLHFPKLFSKFQSKSFVYYRSHKGWQLNSRWCLSVTPFSRFALAMFLRNIRSRILEEIKQAVSHFVSELCCTRPFFFFLRSWRQDPFTNFEKIQKNR